MAKQFDKDGDGKLNAVELAAARKALKSGYSTKFLFGLEASANRLSANSLIPGFDYDKRHEQPVSNRINHIRVMQKRGKFLIGEDFTPIAPKMTIQDQNGYATRTEMKEDRKRKDMTLITAQNDKFESETLRKLQEQG